MLFKVSEKVRGEIVIPSIARPLIQNDIIDLKPEQYCASDIQVAIQKGYLIPKEKDEDKNIQFEKENQKKIKIKNISRGPLVLYDILNPGDCIFISEEQLEDPMIKIAKSINSIEIIYDKNDTEEEDTEEEENPPCDDGDNDPNRTLIDNTEELLKASEEDEKDISVSWDPHTKTTLTREESHENIFGEPPIKQEKEAKIVWIDKEDEEDEEDELEVITIGKKKKTSKKKPPKKKTSKSLKPVGRVKTPPVDGILSLDSDETITEANLVFGLDSKGNLVNELDDISFVDDEQKAARKNQHPKMPNNEEIF